MLLLLKRGMAMASEVKSPLGYIELNNGLKAIFAMNDIFLNYTFEDAAYWETLRSMVNLFLDAYRQKNSDTILKPIEGNIVVKTQYQHLLNIENTTKDQDIKITEDEENTTYIEFQNRAKTQPPIETRAIEYFGLGIGHGKGKIANQIWLLAEDLDSVLHGEQHTFYILKDEVADYIHPTSSGIMYVSLSKLSQMKSPVGELASFLLGKTIAPENEDVRTIVASFNSSFDAFKADKEVVKMLSVAERYRNDGWYDGVAEGKSIGIIEGKIIGITEGVSCGANKVVELIKSGLSPDEALRKVSEEKNTLVESILEE